MAPLIVTMGDPAGIGGEITLKAWLARASTPFLAIADPDYLPTLNLPVPIQIIENPIEAAAIFPTALPVIPIRLATPPTPGQPTTANAPAIIASIERAVRYTLDHQASAVVTNPISKATLYSAAFAYPGHTEFLGALTSATPVMMLACPQLRVVPVTIHVSLRRALETLTTDAIIAAARTTAAALRRDFGIAHPRLAIAGLNPHAGESGTMGTEEETVIQPAINALRAANIDATGPWPPDTMFTSAARARYDAAICMYHDQALIPLKTLDINGGVNVTIGLPIIRTSPDHGTAFDIAGTGRADPASLIAALQMAAAIAAHRSEPPP